MSSSSRIYQSPLLVPFAYTLATRLNSRRDFLYNLAMAWLPAVALLILCGGIAPLPAVANFAIGYLAFISIYELGYLGNDVWDARRDPAGRKRLRFIITPSWVSLFVAIRLIIFAAIAILTGWWTNLFWSAGFLLLVIAFTLHNVVSRHVRLVTFPILTILRFLLPILGLIDLYAAKVGFVVAALPYLMPRWFAYAESKDIINHNLRKVPSFRSLFLVTLAPFVALASFALETWVPIALHGYYLLVTFAGERVAMERPRR